MMTWEEIIEGLNCCSEFLCKQCPYNQYASHKYPLRCIHKLITDLKEILPENLKASDITKTLEIKGVNKDGT